MTEADPRLRVLYRLARHAEGDDLARVMTAIRQRRREIEIETRGPSAFDGLPTEEPATA
jgi:hypothetical protein